MIIQEINFPEPYVCSIIASEDAETYAAACDEAYRTQGKFYCVKGYKRGETPREVLEAHYGIDLFRNYALNRILEHEGRSLLAQACSEKGLTTLLIEGDPSLLAESDDGFTIEIRFPFVPEVDIPKCTGFSVTAPRAVQMDVLCGKIAEGLDIPLPQLAVDMITEQRLEAMQRQVSQQGISMAIFLEKVGKTEEDLQKDLKAAAEREITTKIVLYNIARIHNLFPTQQQLEAEYASMVKVSKKNEQVYHNKTAQKNIANRLALHNASQYLTEHNSLITPAPADAAAAPKPANESGNA